MTWILRFLRLHPGRGGRHSLKHLCNSPLRQLKSEGLDDLTLTGVDILHSFHR